MCYTLSFQPKINFTKWVVLKRIVDQVGLEQRAHLGITGATSIQKSKMEHETDHVDGDRDQNQAHNTCNPMHEIYFFRHSEITKHIP